MQYFGVEKCRWRYIFQCNDSNTVVQIRPAPESTVLFICNPEILIMPPNMGRGYLDQNNSVQHCQEGNIGFAFSSKMLRDYLNIKYRKSFNI